MKSLALYDNTARMHDPILGRFHTPDPLFGNYSQHSPWTHCGANPLNFVDRDGKDICVLYHEGFVVGHMAMLIQNEDEKWEYYSVNGYKWNRMTNGKFGRPFNNVGGREWDSPEAFFESDFNRAGDSEDSKISGFQYRKGFVITSTPGQDNIMRETFQEIAGTDYHLLNNNCATAVQDAMHAAELPTYPERNPLNFSNYINQIIHFLSKSTDKNRLDNPIPYYSFEDIMEANPHGRLITF